MNSLGGKGGGGGPQKKYLMILSQGSYGLYLAGSAMLELPKQLLSGYYFCRPFNLLVSKSFAKSFEEHW